MIRLILGSVLLLGTAVITNDGLERALRGHAAGSLEWGPTLFRVMLGLHGMVLIAFGVHRLRNRPPRSDRPVAFPAVSREGAPTPAWAWWTMSALTLVALGLRLWKLDSCLWYDEIDTLVNIVREPLPKIVTMFSSQNQHMFFSVLARLSVCTLGESAAAVRLPSVVFGVASLWALFLLARRTLGLSVSLLSAALLTFSYHHVWFSQNARGYMGLLLFTLLTTWLWNQARANRRIGWWMAYSIGLALGTWIHMTMIFVPLAHAVVLIASELRRPEGGHAAPPLTSRLGVPALSYALAATLTVQLYALSLPEFLRSALHEVSQPSEWTNPLWVVLELIRGFASTGWKVAPMVTVGGAVTAWGWVRLLKKDRGLAFVFILPGVVAGGTMLALGHNLWPRFFFFCMGFVLLLAMYGVVSLIEFLSRPWLGQAQRRQLAAAVALVMIVASALMLPRNYAVPKQDFIAARDYVERHRSSDDRAVGVGLAGVAYRSLYAPEWEVAQSVEELEALLSRSGRLWLVYTLPIEIRGYHPGLWEVIQDRFERAATFPGTLGDGAMVVCKSRPTTMGGSGWVRDTSGGGSS